MNVAVVGAGIAGLRTAQLLERVGVHVTVFEARNRVGGRMWTANVGGHEFEGGAEWIDVEHDRVLRLLQEFALDAKPADPRPRRHFFNSRIFDPPHIEIDADADGATLADAIAKSTSSLTERAYLTATALSDEGTDPDRVDLAEWKRFNANYAQRHGGSGMSAFRFPESASALCERMAKSIQGDVCLNAELVAVRDSFGVQLKFVDGTRETFDEAVLALPPPCLSRLRVDGEAIWSGIEMSPTCKLALLFERPFWEEDGWSGQLMSDLAVQQVWPCGNALVCYVNGRGMQELVRVADPVTAALESLSRVAPRAQSYFVSGALVDWSADLFAGGGFPYVPPGVTRRATPSKGPVRFAGDWTANWMGFVEGALESAERVVEEFKNEHGLS